MTCPICRQPYGAQIERHHDHLSDFATDELRRSIGACPAAFPPDHLGWRNDQLQRSPGLRRLLRFTGRQECCTPCNTLECAWKTNSNRRTGRAGFLPGEFSLTPAEIAAVRRIGAPKNSDPRVGAAIWAIWSKERRAHGVRLRLIRREVRRFVRNLP